MLYYSQFVLFFCYRYLKAKKRRQQRLDIVVSKLESKIKSLKKDSQIQEQKETTEGKLVKHEMTQNKERNKVSVKSEPSDNWIFSETQNLDIVRGCEAGSQTESWVSQCTHTIREITEEPQPVDRNNDTEAVGAARCRGLSRSAPATSEMRKELQEKVVFQQKSKNGISSLRPQSEINLKYEASNKCTQTTTRKQYRTNQYGKRSCRGRGKMDKGHEPEEMESKSTDSRLDKEVRVTIEPMVQKLVEHFVNHYPKHGTPVNSRSQNTVKVGLREVKGHVSKRKKSMPVKVDQSDASDICRGGLSQKTGTDSTTSSHSRQDNYNYRYNEVWSCARCRCYRRKSKWMK